MRIKNTTRKRLPEKVVVFAFIVFNPFVTRNKYVYLSSQFLITINLKEESMENNKAIEILSKIVRKEPINQEEHSFINEWKN